MNPTAPPPPKPQPPEPPHDDAYAQALLHADNAEFAADEAHQPKQKHLISKKWIIYTIISIVLTIIFGLIYSHFNKSSSGSSTNNTQQDVKAITNFNNPQAY